ncbi:MAG: MBOAT family O-acyltransferase [Hyphomicrobiaceae bacterium]|nr:MBOAT family O-acyltransferase [Hyphomicrobiaceae bacterium]
MSFTEIAFFAFLPLVLALYHLFHDSLRIQNALIFVASLFFYGWWDWRFLSLFLLSIVVAYGVGRMIETSKHARVWLGAGIVVLVGILVTFKYANFFIDSFLVMLAQMGFSQSKFVLQIILPIGISFYTFQAIAYMVDVYRRDIRAERDFICFGAFIAFFPQLVAGPIERARDLLTQFHRRRTVTRRQVAEAIWLIVLGYFVKIGIADVLAPHVELAYSTRHASGWWVVLGTLAFALQIYGDFLGYSLIAKGVALLFGIELIWNFNFPYWATSLVDFWRRWHISLSNWLRDYIYVPLGGSRGSQGLYIRNLMLTMLLGGLWHGASWTFVLWGALHGVALGINHLIGRWPPAYGLASLAGWITTMSVVLVGWFLFRAGDSTLMLSMIGALGNFEWYPAHSGLLAMLVTLSGVIAALEWAEQRYGRFFVLDWPAWPRAALTSLIVAYIVVVSQHTDVGFIYFQF